MSERSRDQEYRALIGSARSTAPVIGPTSTPCESCKWGINALRRNHREVTNFCRLMEREVPSDLVWCSDQRPVAEMTLEEMYELAIPIDTRLAPGQHL